MTDAKRNIVLVSIDSLRADHCGHLGDDRGLTSTMDTLAEDGVAFEAAIAPGPQTFSSMPTVFTGHPRSTEPVGRYPGTTHWERRLAAIDEHLHRYPSLPERLGELGYTTAAFTPNPWTSTASGFDRGFDYFHDFSGEDDAGVHRLLAMLDRSGVINKPVKLALDMLTGSAFFARWQSFYDEIDAVRDRLPEPYFLWIFLLDTHYPFLPSWSHHREQSVLGTYSSALRSERAMRGSADSLPERVRDSLERSYRDTVRETDAFFDRFLADAEADDPAVIVHSDHGESFGDHGNYGHHHRNLYEENVHVPYVVYNAGESGTVPEPTSLATVPRVACSIARGEPIDPEGISTQTAVATSEEGTKRAVRHRRFKYIETDEQRSLFDLHADAAETTNVAHAHPDRVQTFRTRLESVTAHREEIEELSVAARTVTENEDL